MSNVPRPLNALQRRYFAWASPHYARMPHPLRGEVERIDRWLWSARAAWLWIVLGVAAVATTGVFRAAGLPWGPAILAAGVAWFTLSTATLGAWLQPERLAGGRPFRLAIRVLALAYAGALSGLLVARLFERGDLRLVDLPSALATSIVKLTPLLLPTFGSLVLVMWSVSWARRFRMQKEVDSLRAANDRDAVARELAEARLRMLQQQIEPHFIFNTLAAVQHWVDRGDPRAGPLLRALTTFLRDSTESLTRTETRFAEELAIVRAYLSIMSARLGERLRHAIEVDPAALAQTLPPGLVLTLVENAIEHGVGPAVQGGCVTIDARVDASTWTLRVADDGVGLASDWRDGIGLANCRERLGHRFGDRASLVIERLATGTQACVTIGPERCVRAPR